MKEQYKLEDVLDKVIRNTNNFKDLDGFIRPEMNTLCKFLLKVSDAATASKTTSAMLAWQGLTDVEQARLLEHYNKHQLVVMAIAFCNVVQEREARNRFTLPGMLTPDIFGKLTELKEKFDKDMENNHEKQEGIDPEEENPDGDEHDKD
jgi:hypothetical protein